MVKTKGCTNKSNYHYLLTTNELNEKKHYFLNINQIMEFFPNLSKRAIYEFMNPDNDCYALVHRKNKNIKSIQRIKEEKIKFKFLPPNENQILH